MPRSPIRSISPDWKVLLFALVGQPLMIVVELAGLFLKLAGGFDLGEEVEPIGHEIFVGKVGR